ncbi:biotin/lipoyl-binding protein [bacterium]|nr:MAG: biotin/lipoyl-binding protein [bacterium]
MKRLIKGLIVILIMAAAGVLITFGVRPKPVAVAMWEMKNLEISETVTGVATGFIEPAKRISIQPEISARIKEIKVKRGDRAKTGETLVVLDDSDFKDQLRALDAAIPLFDARVKQAKAHVAQLKRDFDRAKKIYDAGALAGQQFDNAKTAIALGTAELEAAESALHQAHVNRDITYSSLRKTLVKAPFEGILLDSSLEVGQLWSGLAISSLAGGSLSSGSGRSDAIGAASGASTLLSQTQGSSQSRGQLELVDDSQMFVVVDIDENDYWKIKTGQTASLVIDALDKRKMTGNVVEIYPFISRALDQNRTARVKIRLSDDLEADILPGMSVNTEILVSSRKDVLAAPTAAILVRPKGKIVYQVVAGVLKEIQVETGVFNWEWSEITSGLSVGDRIAKPPEDTHLKEGMRVIEKDHDL